MGLLITIEGGEYTGKSSVVVPGLVAYIKALEIAVLASREPGGTKKGEELRALIFEKAKAKAPASQLALYFNKARKIHLEEQVIPYLGHKKEKRAVVVLDRYLDSTRVYQGLEGGVPLEYLRKLEHESVDGYFPDLTIILYFPEDSFETILQKRMKSERQTTSWDNNSFQIQLKRQHYYLMLPQLAKEWGETRQFALVDAAQEKKSVVQDVIEACKPLLKREFGPAEGV